MSAKEALVFVMDVGPSMWQNNHHSTGNDRTRWEVARQILIKLVTAKIADCRKTDLVSVILCGVTSIKREYDFSNPSTQEYFYKNIKTLKNWGNRSTDCLKALIGAINSILSRCRNRNYSKRIYLITDAAAYIDDADMAVFEKSIGGENIGIDVIGVDFEETEEMLYEKIVDNPTQILVIAKSLIWHTTDKSTEAAQIVSSSRNNRIFTSNEALNLLSQFRSKIVRPTTVFRGTLSLGDSSVDPDTALEIPIHIYVKTAAVRRPMAEQCLPQTNTDNNTLTYLDVDVSHTYSYVKKIEDENDESTGIEQIVLKKDDLTDAYEFGQQIVPISDMDGKTNQAEIQKSFKLIGFVPASDRYLRYTMSSVYQVCPVPDLEASPIAISAFVHAMYEMNAYALVRYTYTIYAAPRIGLLWPCIKPGAEYLYYTHLPFAEDVQQVAFAPLSTKDLDLDSRSKYAPTAEQLVCMENFVDCFNLTPEINQSDSDISEQPKKYLSGNLVSVDYQHIQHCIEQRAIHPNTPLPSLNPDLLKQLAPPPVNDPKQYIAAEALCAAFPTKKSNV
ncbi:SPOC like C-terminal domain-containing protein [Syncephalis fuscata]|nr:SPOC like C-terminal domain-containing protein [Syncephalis fuscata]